MSVVTSIDQIRPVKVPNTVSQDTVTASAGSSKNFQTVFNQAVSGQSASDRTVSSRIAIDPATLDPDILERVRKDKISSSDHGQYDEIFAQASACYNLPVALLKAITKVESDFNPNDVSSAGAKGLMQLMPSTAAEVGVTDPFDPWQNIMGATKYIRKQLDRFGDLRVALAAYNTGPGNVKKYGGEPSYCKRYVDKVLAYMGEAEVDTGNVGAAYDILASQGSVYNQMFGSLGSSYGALGGTGGFGLLGSLGSSYGALGGLGGSLGILGNSYSMGGYGMLGGLSGSYGLLGMLGNTYGSLGSSGSLLGGSDGLLGSSDGLFGSSGSGFGMLGNSNYAFLYALSSILSANPKSAGGEEDDTVTMSREGFNNMIELMRIQSMMSAQQSVGSMSLL